MINLTNSLLIIKNKNLKDEFIKSYMLIREKLIEYYNLNSDFEILNSPKYSYIKYASFENVDKIDINENFIKELYFFSDNKNSENILIKYNLCESNIVLERPYLMIGFKMIFLDMWKKGFFLLPLNFNLNTKIIDFNFESEFDNNLIKSIKNNFLINKKLYSENFKKNYIKQISKLIRTTNYNSERDVSLLEINNLHISVLLSLRGESDLNVKTNKFYFEFFLNYINNISKLEKYDSFKYKKWLSGYSTRHKRINYIDYLELEDDLKEYRRKYNIKQTIERNSKKRKNNIKKTIVRNNKVESDKDINKNPSLIKKEFNLEDLFFNMHLSKKYSWKNKKPHYEDYNIESNESESEMWIEIFKSYMNHRKRNGYEQQKTNIVSFNFLMHYIFFYLKMWNKDNNKCVSIPTSPKYFFRTIYINNTSISSKREERPFTITELLEYRYESASNKNIYLRNLEGFFNFIIDFYSEESSVWGESLSNPIRKNDYYKEHIRKKTNKVIIPKNIYVKLKQYLYSLEAFGEHLQNKVLSKNFVDFNFSNKKTLNTEELGYIPFFYDKGKCYPIYEINNCYLYKRRKFDINKLKNKSEEENIVSEYITSNTVIRAFILMLNTGLRGAQVSWLDRDTWDLNDNKDLKAYYKINVNTDKTKNSEWSTYVPHNVYNSLKKETLFQNSMREDFINLAINYQGREYSRFENIICLFKSDSKKALPVNFKNYWVDILWSFQNILNEVENENYELIKITKHNSTKINFTTEGNQYSPLNIKAIHTPHSMRATFCTHMAEYLERSDIAALVGHASDLITSEVYIKPEDSVISEKIRKATDILDNGVNSDYFDKESKAHIKPNQKGSSLQKAFSENRDQTIELFNITSISMNVNKDSEEQSQKAIKLLKDARMDKVIFETTHICPVGGMCPQEVMSVIGEKRRCGLCPLALKCIDNLNPIYAKQRDLMREIKEGKEKLDLAIKNKESNITIDDIENKVNLDIRELVSWKFSADILSKHYESIKDNKNIDKQYYVEMPDMVKNHLTKVSVSNEKEYLLTRIADSNAYSGLSNSENKYQAEMIRRNVIKNLNLFEYDDYIVSEDDKIEVFCSMIKNMLDTNGIGLNELVNYDCFKSIENKKEQKKLLFKDIKLLK